ncbi:HEPN domain-containing protein [Aliirhizobium smilacinae]|uniref:HEPN domain-containing protein n=1 Tax=Aliirhizobium smilacinae TaxID=1395944 RepID=A0A5C4XK87_9HYPH|nr:HEPN domain-containing protein [Rhizobium smilacinae]TNM63040.1 HEPN domain-containing protein [Rhizobium smilacinae]
MDLSGAEGFDAALTLTDILDHLPSTKRREIARVLEVIFDEVERHQSTKSSQQNRRGKILKVILFGSYARGDWVEDRLSGYRSDYDILVVVNSHSFAEDDDLWLGLDDRLIQLQIAGHVKTPTSPIVHSLQDVNNQLAQGRPFFVDILRDGKMLYQSDPYPLAQPKPLNPAEAKEEARRYFDQWIANSFSSLETAAYQLTRSRDGSFWLNHSAFSLHQACESAYHCFLLTMTLYSPKSHRIRNLRSKAESIDARLIAAWPRDSRLSRRRFELLVRAYVEARYSPKYQITAEELEWLVERVETLQVLVQKVCLERLAEESL